MYFLPLLFRILEHCAIDNIATAVTFASDLLVSQQKIWICAGFSSRLYFLFYGSFDANDFPVGFFYLNGLVVLLFQNFSHAGIGDTQRFCGFD